MDLWVKHSFYKRDMRMAEARWMQAARPGFSVHNAAGFRTPSGAAPELEYPSVEMLPWVSPETLS